MTFTVSYFNPTGLGSASLDSASDALTVARAAMIAGELKSVTDTDGVEFNIQELDLLARKEWEEGDGPDPASRATPH